MTLFINMVDNIDDNLFNFTLLNPAEIGEYSYAGVGNLL